MSLKIDIVIISYNCCNLTLSCINSVQCTKGILDISITVVDNASSDETVDIIRRKYPDVKVIQNPENYGYAKAVNIGMDNTNNEFVIVSNADVQFQPKAILVLAKYLEIYPDIGIAGPQQQFPGGIWQRSYGDLPGTKLGLKNLFFIDYFERLYKRIFWGKFSIDSKPKEVPYIDGAVMAIRRRAFEDTGGFEEDYFFYTEEADFCYKLRKRGWKVIFCPDSLVTHLRGGSALNSNVNESNIEMLISSKALFCRKHLSKNETRNYISMELLHSRMLELIWKVLFFFVHDKKASEERMKTHNLFVRYWQKELNSLE